MPDIGTGNLNLRELKKHLDNMSKVNSWFFFSILEWCHSERVLGKTPQGVFTTSMGIGAYLN
jgi:hypothetical protein